MRTKGVNKEQQLKYILECRNSGLTDYQWCQEHGIHPGTFYNWVSKLKKAGYADIPDPNSAILRELNEGDCLSEFQVDFVNQGFVLHRLQLHLRLTY